MGKSGKDKTVEPQAKQPQNGRGRPPESREERRQATKAQHRAEKEGKTLDTALAKAGAVIAEGAKAPETKDVKPGEKVREEGGHAVYRHKDARPAPPDSSAPAAPAIPVTDLAPDRESRLEPAAKSSAPLSAPDEAPSEKPSAKSLGKAPEAPQPAPLELKDAIETPVAPSAILAIFDEMQNRLEGDAALSKRLRQMNLSPEMQDVIARAQAEVLREMRERLAGVGLAAAAPAAPAAPVAPAEGPVPVKEIPCWNKEVKEVQDAAAASWREAQAQKALAQTTAAQREAAMASWGGAPKGKPQDQAAAEDDAEDEADDAKDAGEDEAQDETEGQSCCGASAMMQACRSWMEASDEWRKASDKWQDAVDEWHEASDAWCRVSEKVWDERVHIMKPLSWYAWLFLVVLVGLFVFVLTLDASMRTDVRWCDPAAVKEEALAAFLEKPEELAPLRTDWTGCLSAGLASFAADRRVLIADSRGLLASGRPQADVSHEVAASVIEAARTKACGAPAPAEAAK